MQLKTLLFGAAIFGAVSVTILAARSQKPPMTAATGTPAFEGRALLGVSDADLSATGYANGILQRVRGKEDAAFNRNGENVAIAIYQYAKGEDSPPENGYIGFWNVDRSGSQPALKQTGYTIPVTRGLHDLVLIP